ncbi:hypothetical protein NE237_012167 [Protea cynaroides]|uniref:non-specific serine/threonine protein kinase n=1 Tax=Protea cynaroides TaxID=273540 RepID=A0A9Q0JWK1_9MAGN|nr:hypothetical protein NE237_012167 [Protea cynaroides]
MGLITLVLLSSICTNIAILLLWCSSCIAHSTSLSNETDRQALQAFKARITHDPFHVLSSWNDSVPYCDWQGLLCGGRRHPNRVIALYLGSQGLVGSVAPEIGNLSFLREIQLQNNSFHGEIPSQVSFLFRFHELFLDNNSFEGEIPPNISRCTNLIQLRLGYNNILGKIPVELGTLSKLQVLRLENNRLTGQIPPSFGNLSSLYQFLATENGLSRSIPNTLGQMKRLMHLMLGINNLSGTIPPTIYNLSLLSHFEVSANQIQGSLPPNLGFSLPNLVWLSIADNQFDGPIPNSISNLSKLESLFVSENNFSGKFAIHFGGLSKLTYLLMSENHLGTGEADDLSFITTMNNCTSLIVLELGANRFGGVLPNSIANLSTQLTWFSLSNNQIFGNIPIGIGNLVSLQHINLSVNLLEGSIPTSIGTLQNLHQLELFGNRLTGPIHVSFGNLTSLIVLYLEDNHLNGKIPSSIGKWKDMLFLNLSGNSFNGNISKEIFNFSNLIKLDVGRNHFIGSLPWKVGRLINLEILDVSKNMLSGEIPSSLGDCTSLEHLFMKGNLLQGSIPLSLGSLRGLQDLDLSHNNFSGFIPKYLGTFKFLHNLNISFNHLEGEVPVEGVFGNLNQVSIVGNNKLCGGIPELYFPICQTRRTKKDGKPHVFRLIVIICSCGGFLCLILLTYSLIICRRRKEIKESTIFLIGDHYFKISYSQLHKATDGFSVANLIGVGSFGSVYKGVLNYHGETIVAVKVFNINQRGAFKSFAAECEALRNIRHRNLVKILTSCSSVDFEGNEFIALVYEFMSGGNLESWLHPHANGGQGEQRHLNLEQRLNIAIDIATTLDYLHHHCHTQIIHCDLKPSNILLDDDLTAHVGDFGISRILSNVTGRSQNETSSIEIKGSIGYTTPGIVLLFY